MLIATRVQLSEPAVFVLPGYQTPLHRVLGFERRRNNGPMLTLAVAEWWLPIEGVVGGGKWKPVNDIVTRMRLADMAGGVGLHDMPRNADRLYGAGGR